MYKYVMNGVNILDTSAPTGEIPFSVQAKWYGPLFKKVGVIWKSAGTEQREYIYVWEDNQFVRKPYEERIDKLKILFTQQLSQKCYAVMTPFQLVVEDFNGKPNLAIYDLWGRIRYCYATELTYPTKFMEYCNTAFNTPSCGTLENPSGVVEV